MEKAYTWEEVANLTHETQLQEFGWCACEEQEYFPYTDCPNFNSKVNPDPIDKTHNE